jgi:hypothetical protein
MHKEIILINEVEPHCASCATKPEVIHKPRTSTNATMRTLTAIKKTFLSSLLAGEVYPRASKGDLNQLETGFLIEWGSDERENVNLAAIKALALCAYL